MTREEKIKLAIEKGYKYDPETGYVTGPSGKIIKSKTKKGYTQIGLWDDKKLTYLFAHHFAYYMIYGKCPYKVDHINRDRSNKIENLREGNNFMDGRNRKHKGYYKVGNKYRVRVRIGKDTVYDKRFNTEEEARNAYLEAKRKYHPEFNV